MSLFDMLNISGSALAAERQRAEVTSANLANAETTHTDEGGPYVRKEVVFNSTAGSPFLSVINRLGKFSQNPAGSVHISNIVNDTTPAVMRYEPGNPDADKSGYVAYPAINPVPDGFGAGIPVERFGGERGQADDPRVDRHFEDHVGTGAAP